MAAQSTVPYAHSAAGHQGISTSADGALLIKPCTQAEIDFYESAKDHALFQAHMPVYMGKLALSDDPAIQGLAGHIEQNAGVTAPSNLPVQAPPANGGKAEGSNKDASASTSWKPSGGAALTTGIAIVLSNATAGFVHPNVIDLKLGARLWDDKAPMEKRAKLDKVSAETTSGSLGFRIAGMRVYIGEEPRDGTAREINTEVTAEGYKVYDKNYGRSLTEQNTKPAFEAYLRNAVRCGRGKFIAERILREVQSVQFALEEEQSRMYSASILIVYEGDAAALEQSIKLEEEQASKEQSGEGELDDEEDDDVNEEEDEEKNKVHDVRLIDFAHAHWTPGQGPDENALQGVRSVRKILEEMVGSIDDGK